MNTTFVLISKSDTWCDNNVITRVAALRFALPGIVNSQVLQ